MNRFKEYCFNVLIGLISAYLTHLLALKYPEWMFTIAFSGGATTLAIMDLINPFHIKK